MKSEKLGTDPVGAVMVVGAGIAGVQAALDLADAGFYVYVVEAQPAIGGVMAQLFKVPLNNEGFFLEAHMKLRPVDFATEGVFVAGLAHYPKPLDEAIAQAKAAAARAAVVLSQESIKAGGVVASIDPALCSGCQACVGACPFGAIGYKESEKVCEVNQALCKGCGTCAANCPSECITLLGFSHKQSYTQIDQALAELQMEAEAAG